MNPRDDQIHFDAHARAVQNHMTGNVNMWTVPSQLRPVYAEMVRKGEKPWALVTMTQGLYADLIRKAPAQVFYPPIAYSYHAQASQRAKTF